MQSIIVGNSFKSRNSYYETKINEIVKFESINEFVKYVSETPTNKLFKNEALDTKRPKSSWYGDVSYEEAIEMARFGWVDGSADLNATFKCEIKNNKIQNAINFSNKIDVVGFQPIVPLYLQGCPMNMMSRKPHIIKNKIITVNSVLSVGCCKTAEETHKMAVDSLIAVKRIEELGYRINLNLLMSLGKVCVKIRLKSANERLNVNKLAFPMTHVAMFRRLFFRFIETYPSFTERCFVRHYGTMPTTSDFEVANEKDEIMIGTLYRITTSNLDDSGAKFENLLKKFK